jgi:meiotic recombination protein DMC1
MQVKYSEGRLTLAHYQLYRLLSSLLTKCSVSTHICCDMLVQLTTSTPCVADPGATMTFVAGGALKPIGGHILSHASATRIFLRKGMSPVNFRL